MKRGTEEHPKTADLADRLDLSKWEVVGLLESLWIFAAKYAPRGDVGKWSAKRIATWLEWTRTEPERLLEALIEAGYLDRGSGPAVLVVHDWPDHADDAVHMALARARLCFADGRTPKLGRLPREERASAEQWYRSHQHPAEAGESPSVSTESTRRAHAVTTACRSPVRPILKKELSRAAARSPAAPAAWAVEAAESLRESVRRRWPGAPVPESLVTWAKDLERIKATAEIVQEALRWYVAAARDGDRYLPECRSGRAFREKFDRVLAARQRSGGIADTKATARPRRYWQPQPKEGGPENVVAAMREAKAALRVARAERAEV